MKKIKLLGTLFLCISLSVLTSCSDDDEGNGSAGTSASSSKITFDGTDYNMSAGLVSDYGPIGVGVPTHYNFDFAITDDNLVQFTDTSVNETYYVPGSAATISVYLELFSPDTTGFKVGTFTYMDGSNLDSAAVSGRYFFTEGEVELDSNGVVMGDFDGDEFEVTGGAVVVSGTGPTNYTISYNLQTERGKTVTGTYKGPFIYEDQR